MNVLKGNSTVLITCAPGLGKYIKNEIEQIGFDINNIHDGGVQLTANLEEAINLNIYLRTAYNILFLLKEFYCITADELYRKIKEIPWEEIINSDEYFSIVSRVNNPNIKNWTFANLKTKDAIVDRIREATGKRPDTGNKKNNLVINLYWNKERAWIYLNTTGRKLSDRGYRKIPYKAPLRESLAAGIIMETGYDGTMPLINPMCGSGTIVIEAALIAAQRPAGLMRSNYSFMHMKNFDDEWWKNLRNNALKEGRKKKKRVKIAPIIATDISEDAINAAKKNAMTAGVEHLIDFNVCDFKETNICKEKGIVIINPEYGKRLGEIKKLENIYKNIGDFFKNKCQGYTCYIFTGNMPLSKKVGLRSGARIPFYNADIECRLLKYDIYEGTRSIKKLNKLKKNYNYES